jgi:hypothetical protein
MSLALPKVPPVAPGRVSGPNSIRFAHGRVVVYVDNNGNQKLDLVDRSQPRYPDEILAFSSDSLYFIDGNPSPSSSPSVLDANGRAPKTGYNARRDAAQCDPFQMAIEPSCRSFVAWQGPTVGLDLRSPGTSLVQLLMCREGILNQGSGSSAERVPTNRESMDTRWSTAGTCSADGLHLMVESAKVGDLRKVCDEVYVSTSTTHYSLATAADAPSWWPCRPTPR